MPVPVPVPVPVLDNAVTATAHTLRTMPDLVCQLNALIALYDARTITRTPEHQRRLR